MQQIIASVIEHIRLAWPNSTVQTAESFDSAIEIVNRLPCPDIVLLDLSLPDSTMEETISRLGQITDRCPVLIITGHTPDELSKAGFEGQVPVMQKGGDLKLFADTIIRGIALAFASFQQAKWGRMESNIQRMKQLASDAP